MWQLMTASCCTKTLLTHLEEEQTLWLIFFHPSHQQNLHPRIPPTHCHQS
jgi:hypothetical protein